MKFPKKLTFALMILCTVGLATECFAVIDGKIRDETVYLHALLQLGAANRAAFNDPNIRYESGQCDAEGPEDHVALSQCIKATDQGRASCPENWVFSPVYVRTRPDKTHEWSRRKFLSGGYCDGAPAPENSIIAQEFRTMRLTPSPASAGPPGAWLPVNMDNIAYTSDQPQTLVTTILGQPVLITATPIRFAWDFGDGSPGFTTSQPGGPYPDHIVAHPYSRPGTYTTTLTTTWAGSFSLDDGATHTPITGTATTTTMTPPITVTEHRTHLTPNI